MKAIILFALLAIATSVKINPKFNALLESNNLNHLVDQVRNTPYGEMVMNLISLHMEVQGPINDLKTAIEDLIHDLTEKYNNASAKFQADTEAHNNRVSMLQAQIASAKQDISGGNLKLNNVLIPRREQLTEDIAGFEENIVKNKRRTAAAIAQREKEHSVFLRKQAEHHDAIEAINQALELVRSLLNSNPSLVQVRRVKASLKKIKTHFSKYDTYGPLIESLIALSQNFSDQGSVQKIIDLLNRLLHHTQESLNQLVANENAAVAAHKENLQNLADELSELESNLATARSDLEKTNETIKETREFVAQRKVDLGNHEAELKSENESYANIKKVFEDLVNQFKIEAAAVKKALEILSKINVREYLVKRVNNNEELPKVPGH